MSEFEKKQRDEYKERRKKLIFYQQIGLCVLAVLLLIFSALFFKFNKDTYVEYTQNGRVVYHAYLNENNDFKEEYINGENAYISTLVKEMDGVFHYALKFDNAGKVKFTYTYTIEEQLMILDQTTGAPLNDTNPEGKFFEVKVGPVTVSDVSDGFSIDKTVPIDYRARDKQAEDFIRKYNLSDSSSSTLIVRMRVSVVGVSDAFASTHSNEHVTELKIPLRKDTFKPTYTSSAPTTNQKILAIGGNLNVLFGVLSIISLVAFLLDIGIITFFVLSTRDKFIDYSIKVNRIRKNYKSYIQNIVSDFETDGYRVLRLNEFGEMLEIRDTVQKPILAYENEDKTKTRFFIIADSSMVYLYEIEVDNFASGLVEKTEPAEKTEEPARKAPEEETTEEAKPAEEAEPAEKTPEEATKEGVSPAVPEEKEAAEEETEKPATEKAAEEKVATDKPVEESAATNKTRVKRSKSEEKSKAVSKDK